ncbi:ghrelin-like [Hyperolius riggenbachi]|uniref:ghrelin-like n=1 Tax=Hyperolius riggenbachi TaxID=752182 RepID=UPI0035A2FD0D
MLLETARLGGARFGPWSQYTQNVQVSALSNLMSVHLVLQSRRLEMRLGNVALFGAVLFCLLWTEEVQAGSSFLSPADMQKNAVTIPMDISVKMTLEQFQKQKAAIQDFLYTLLSPGQSQETQEERGQSDDQ